MVCNFVFWVVRGSEWSVKVLQSVSWNPHCSVELRLIGQAAARWTLQCCSQHSQSVNIRTHSGTVWSSRKVRHHPRSGRYIAELSIMWFYTEYPLLYECHLVWRDKDRTTLQLINYQRLQRETESLSVVNHKLVFSSFHHLDAPVK